jgi:hypothetical protein
LKPESLFARVPPVTPAAISQSVLTTIAFPWAVTYMPIKIRNPTLLTLSTSVPAKIKYGGKSGVVVPLHTWSIDQDALYLCVTQECCQKWHLEVVVRKRNFKMHLAEQDLGHCLEEPGWIPSTAYMLSATTDSGSVLLAPKVNYAEVFGSAFPVQYQLKEDTLNKLAKPSITFDNERKGHVEFPATRGLAAATQIDFTWKLTHGETRLMVNARDQCRLYWTVTFPRAQEMQLQWIRSSGKQCAQLSKALSAWTSKPVPLRLIKVPAQSTLEGAPVPLVQKDFGPFPNTFDINYKSPKSALASAMHLKIDGTGWVQHPGIEAPTAGPSNITWKLVDGKFILTSHLLPMCSQTWKVERSGSSGIQMELVETTKAATQGDCSIAAGFIQAKVVIVKSVRHE